MTVKEIEKLFEYLAGIDFYDDKYTIFDDLDLDNNETGKTIKFNSIEEMLQYKIDGETISDHLDKMEFIFYNDTKKTNLKDMNLE